MLKFLKSLLGRYGEDSISDKAAALSYYTIFSIGPLLFIIFGIIGKILQNGHYKARLLSQLQKSLGPQAGDLIKNVLNSQSFGSKAALAFVIGGVGLVLGAIGIFGQMQKSLNAILHVKIGPGAGIKTVIKQKIISLGLVGVISFLLIVSLLASTIISEAVSHINHSATTGILIHLLDFVVSLVIFSLLLTIIYRTLPAVKLPWKVLFTASLVIALLFSIGKIVLGIIIGNNKNISAFGAAGSLIALLLWIFYSGQIVYLGAAGISLYAERHSLPLRPRFKAPKAVLKVRQVEESLSPSAFRQKVRTHFEKGVEGGWRKSR
jgi:membrane protein